MSTGTHNSNGLVDEHHTKALQDKKMSCKELMYQHDAKLFWQVPLDKGSKVKLLIILL